VRRSDTREKVSKCEEELVSNFACYLDYFDDHPPFKIYQRELHRETIRLRMLADVRRAIRSDEFIKSLHDTLRAWRVNRGAELLSQEEISNRLRDPAIESKLARLEVFFIDDPDLNGQEIAESLWELISDERFRIKSAANKIESSSKALHHLLPDLVPPIDREYTRVFFHWHGPQFQYNPKEVFLDIFEGLLRIAKNVGDLGRYVTKQGWRTSRTKIIDNAIIGFCLKNELHLS